jgi:hypothetical protein
MGVSAQERARFNQLQALDDAIAFRLARLGEHCTECEAGEPGASCDDHACDVALVARYRERAEAMLAPPRASGGL